MMFPLSLTGKVKTLLDELNEGTIGSYEELRTAFISRFFPNSIRPTSRRNPMISQHERESITDAWLRMKELLRNFHGHGLTKGNIIKIFYHGLDETTHEALNAAAGGIFLYKTPNQAYQPLKDKVLLKLDWDKIQKPKTPIHKTVAFTSEGSNNSDTNKILAKMDVMAIKMKARYNEMKSGTKCNSCKDQSFQYSVGIAGNMLVKVGKFTFPMDFVILEMEEDIKVPLILGRPFLHTADAVNHVKQKQLNLGVSSERMVFSIDLAMKHSYSNDDTCFSIDVIDEILGEYFGALLDEGSKILYSNEGTPSKRSSSPNLINS
nr:reverse transcriptase domain-containing protein [Tanacetum cinerariifolium]